MSNELNFTEMGRYWFLTWTTYGTWLPGDPRGFVGNHRDKSGQTTKSNQFGNQPAKPEKNLYAAIKRDLKSQPIFLSRPQAGELFEQFKETARIRNWLLLAVGIMRAHIHVVIAVPDDPDPSRILNDLKAYGSGRLNKKFGRPESDTRWTTGGSTRKLDGAKSIETAIHYVRTQPNPLLIWTRDAGLLLLDDIEVSQNPGPYGTRLT